MEKERRDDVSRRWVIKALSCVICALPLSGAGLIYAQTKMSKEQAGYVDRPKGKEMCSDCANFVRPSACTVVAGEISPQGWCRYWAPR